MTLCKICGKYNCKKHIIFLKKNEKTNVFSGSTPPEIFIGTWNYPNPYIGVLSPKKYGDTKEMSSPEEWYKKKLKISQITNLRNQLIYGRKKENIKNINNKLTKTIQELAMSYKSISTEFQLKNNITKNNKQENSIPTISKKGEIHKIRLEENPKIKRKVDYIVNDTDIKSKDAIIELEKEKVSTSEIIKILSAGLLGLKNNRKLVPTKWSITACDENLSKEKLKKIREYPEIPTIEIFHNQYLGNHYEFILLPEKYSFEVIEIFMKNFSKWKDYEGFFSRKNYADSVTGAYYANRLALTEYLTKIKKQASCIVFREIRPEYHTPLGVGILRETSREAFKKPKEKFNTIKEALNSIDKRIKIKIVISYINVTS